MSPSSDNLPAVGAILGGPYWPSRVRVVRAEACRGGRTLLEAVNHYMLKQPRLRFLLTDDPGAGRVGQRCRAGLRV